MRLVGLCLCLALLGGSPAAGQTTRPDTAAAATPDTSRGEVDWLALPFASYAPSTQIAVGALGGLYWPARPGQPASNVQTSITVTQRRQITAQLNAELYPRAGRWRVVGEVLWSRYPDRFYGVGDRTRAAWEELYTSRYGEADLTVQRRLRPSLRLGGRLYARLETAPAVEGACVPATGPRPPTLACGAVSGSGGGWTLGLGPRLTWDARKNRYYPTRGTYADVSARVHSAAWGSDYTFGRLTADLRGYRPLGPGVLAGQLYTEAVVGAAPFPLMPLLGGPERLRGYREGRYRDAAYWTTQAAYRVPLFWRFKAAAFAAAGDVGPRLGPALGRNLQWAVGLGGRLRLTDDNVHGRLDLAYSPTGIEIYVELGEAF